MLLYTGYKIKNETDQSLGCELDFSLSCNDSEDGFLHLAHVEFYGYDISGPEDPCKEGMKEGTQGGDLDSIPIPLIRRKGLILQLALRKPKVVDFGLPKLLNRGSKQNFSFSKVRGARGYMALEWIFNLQITSKVDVYSYGVVVLEMVTGKSPTTGPQTFDNIIKMEGVG
ncbi:hypothetical protein TEA_004439 [Camellia sinensis var. sinensis]|uniref:Protein kinase domain-containing protein n=1 Tax=Camellia sinensis var. sinensis TaxID=542762 RepID=A0A4V3WIS1_CAMSN|nr:hypothetical protein TEA_004439 [Camellia sinensis var. sinensis]